MAPTAVRIAAGQILDIEATGKYRLGGEGGWVTPVGDRSGRRANNLGVPPFASAAYGAAIAMVGQARAIHPALVAPCSRMVAPFAGLVSVGINDRTPQRNEGAVDFTIRVTNPTAAEWTTHRTGACRGGAAAVTAGGAADEEQAPVRAAVVENAWLRRAAGVLDSLLRSEQAGSIAAAIQRITHPTGKNAQFAGGSVHLSGDRIVVELHTTWSGGFVGGRYSTNVIWELSPEGHIHARVDSDTARVAIAPPNRQQLDDYFRTHLYPYVRTQVR
jgi:hypothetical protein